VTTLTTETGPFTCRCLKPITREAPANGWRDEDGDQWCPDGEQHAPAVGTDPTGEPMTMTVVNVKAVLAAAVEWLYDTDQPDGAIMSHHGAGPRRFGDRTYAATPTGAQGLPVIVIEVADRYLDSGKWRGLDGEFDKADFTSGGRPRANPTAPVPVAAEILAAVAILEDLGVQVRETWNGAPWNTSGSIGLSRPARPSLVAAVTRYRAGCAEHGGVFCSCSWYADGNRLIVGPAWPANGEDRAEAATAAGTDAR
jgi:hypothetical protein